MPIFFCFAPKEWEGFRPNPEGVSRPPWGSHYFARVRSHCSHSFARISGSGFRRNPESVKSRMSQFPNQSRGRSELKIIRLNKIRPVRSAEFNSGLHRRAAWLYSAKRTKIGTDSGNLAQSRGLFFIAAFGLFLYYPLVQARKITALALSVVITFRGRNYFLARRYQSLSHPAG